MAVRTPFIFIETTLAQFFAASRAVFHAGVALTLITAFTSRHALTTVDAVATGTTAIAVAAHSCFALLASPAFVITDNASAVSTPDAVPFGQGHVWAIRVVRPQQVGYDQKEVQ
jgi:hypothetical protein